MRSTPLHGGGCQTEERTAAEPSEPALCPHIDLVQLIGSSPCSKTRELAPDAGPCWLSPSSAGMPPMAAAAAAAPPAASQCGAAQQCCCLAPQQEDRSSRRTAAGTALACRAAHGCCPPTVQQAGFLCCVASMCIVSKWYVYGPYSPVCKRHAWGRCSPACRTRAEQFTGRTHRQAGVPTGAPEAAGVDDGLAGGGQQHERTARGCRPPLAKVLQYEGDRLAEPAVGTRR